MSMAADSRGVRGKRTEKKNELRTRKTESSKGLILFEERIDL